MSVGAVAGLALAVTSAPWLIAVGALCIAGAWLYTGGSKPYGYAGLGEVAVFVFFGLVAVLGTQYTQALRVDWVGLVLALTTGALSSAVLVANNLRDIPTDAQSGKLTLAVRLGDTRTRILYQALLAGAAVLTLTLTAATPWCAVGLGGHTAGGAGCRARANRAHWRRADSGAARHRFDDAGLVDRGGSSVDAGGLICFRLCAQGFEGAHRAGAVGVSSPSTHTRRAATSYAALSSRLTTAARSCAVQTCSVIKPMAALSPPRRIPSKRCSQQISLSLCTKASRSASSNTFLAERVNGI